ncbi:MAG: MobH family relaxase, partial [Gallionella sp.]
IEQLSNIPRYPPFMEGLPIYSPETLLATQKELVDGVRQIIANEILLAEHYMPAMLRLAALVQLLPASQAHHHRGAGGMLRHSLEVGLWSLQQTEGKLIRGVVTPQERRIIEPRWKLTVFLAGMCHDLGKVVTDISVTNRENDLKWRPYHHGLYGWAEAHNIKNYFLHWQEGRGKKHTNVSGTLINSVINEVTMGWINDGGPDAVIWLTESLNNNPGSTNQIHNFVVKADQLSVERDLKSMGVAMAGYEIGVPVERYLTDIMRRLVQEGIWRINEPSARIWNLEGTTYLVWPMAGEEISRRTRDEDIPGLPKSSDGVLDMMLEREIAFLRDGDGDRFYYISPEVITEKIPDMRMKAIRLRDQALISTMPIAPIKGVVHSSRKPEENEGGARTSKNDSSAQAELPLPFEPPPSTAIPPTLKLTEPVAPPIVKTAPTVLIPAPDERVEPLDLIRDDLSVAPEVGAVSEAQQIKVAKPLSLSSLDGAMGELLRVLHADFKSGKKSFDEVAVKQADRTVYLKWPDAFAGYGFTPKQILTELSELGWMIPASEVAKIGDATFKVGVAKSIKLSAVVGHLFGAQDPIPVVLQPTIHNAKNPTVATSSLPPRPQTIADARSTLNSDVVTALEGSNPKSKRQPKKSKPTEARVPDGLFSPPINCATQNYRVPAVLTKKSKGKSIVETD